jgi:hypothetical protein
LSFHCVWLSSRWPRSSRKATNTTLATCGRNSRFHIWLNKARFSREWLHPRVNSRFSCYSCVGNLQSSIRLQHWGAETFRDVSIKRAVRDESQQSPTR